MTARPHSDTEDCTGSSSFCPYLDEIRGQYIKLSHTVEKIERAVVGEEETGVIGLATRVHNSEKDIKKVDSKLLYWGGFVGGASLFAGYLFQQLFK